MTRMKNDPTTEKHTDHPIDRILKETMSDETPDHIERRVQKHFDAFRRRIEEQDRKPRARRAGPLRFPRFAWAGAGVAFAILLVAFIGVSLSQSRLTWADVQERFESVRFFNATIYIAENPMEPPEKTELWVGRNGKCRVHHNGMVFFADKGQLTAAIDAKTGKMFEPDRRSMCIQIIRTLGDIERFSLETFLGTFSGEKQFSPPLQNKEVSLAQDLTVFDITNNRTPEWLRIWVLKSSRLPVRARLWDPRGAETMDILFDYVEEQPDEAFDHQRFQETVTEKTKGRRNRLYALLKDPGGHAITPENLFEETGYHMPEIEDIGITEDGVVWVVAKDSVNRTPQGHRFYGFGKCTDNLGREYVFMPRGHRVRGDVSLEYHIPLDYGDKRPNIEKLILTCTTQPDHPSQAYEEIGSIDVTEWKENAPAPKLFENQDDIHFLRRMIQEMTYRHNWDRFDQLLAKIDGEPENDKEAFFREKMRLKKLMYMKEYDEAFSFAEKLFQIIENDLESYCKQDEELIRTYICLLARNEDYTQARALFEKVSPFYNQMHEQGSYDWYASFTAQIANFCSDRVGWSKEKIEDVFKIDVDDKRFAEYLSSSLTRPRLDMDIRFESWRSHVSEVAEIYRTHPLPDEIEMVPSIEPFDPSGRSYATPLPEHNGYSVVRFGNNWNDLAPNIAVSMQWERLFVRVAEELNNETFNYTVVYNDSLSGKDRYEWLLDARNAEIVDIPTHRTVWVAEYDGRPLPYWREVKPLDASHIRPRADSRGGGTHTNITSLLGAFSNVLNQGPQWTLTDDTVIIIDETGLPTKPAENQTWGSICLTYEYAFWSGKEGIQLAKEWFKENFGITFREEKREIIVHEIRRGNGN